MRPNSRPAATESLVEIMCDERQKAIFADKHQGDLAYSVSGVARFRVNLFHQRSSVSAVLRVINSQTSRSSAMLTWLM